MKPDELDSHGSASFARPEHWHQIDWRDVNDQVRGLQIRIAKAAQDQDWRRVKALQRFLVRSFYGRCWAVRRVTDNAGKRTPGVDGETWSTPESKWHAIQRLDSRGYKPLPLRRIYIPKSNGKMRPLGIPTMRDRAMQALYLLAVEPLAETRADKNSYGFRRERCTADAIAQLFILLARKGTAQWILEGDIKSCFDEISHEWLEKHVLMDKPILRKWLKAGYVESRQLFPTEAGTPQGGIISPTLANWALDGLEDQLIARFGPTQWFDRKNRVSLVRYADDFVITGSSKELLENEVKPLVEKFLAERGLQLSQEKTRITHISEGFDFLGQNVRKYNGKLLIMPSSKNVKTFLDKVRGIIRDNRAAKQENLIGVLNPVIRGWANYHRHIVASRTFADVDYAIWWALWRWARRRHPKKGARWVRKRYFRSIGPENGVFCASRPNSRGETLVVRLFKASHLRIVRHVKVRWGMNPFDPACEEYFEQRKRARMLLRLTGKPFLKTIWRQQEGICGVCGQLIGEHDRWHNHHVIRRTDDGPDRPANRQLLHLNCHRQIHHPLGRPLPAG